MPCFPIETDILVLALDTRLCPWSETFYPQTSNLKPQTPFSIVVPLFCSSPFITVIIMRIPI
jgi:hypothetical protein